jgi:hypothetical protein
MPSSQEARLTKDDGSKVSVIEVPNPIIPKLIRKDENVASYTISSYRGRIALSVLCFHYTKRIAGPDRAD